MRALAILAALFAAPAFAAPVDLPPIGGQRDAHGCLPAAGYVWCAREKSCVRSWELAAARGFSNTPRAFARYCRRRR